MGTRLVLLFSVVVFVSVAVSAGADYWTFTHSFVPVSKSTTNWTGFFPNNDATYGQMNPAYGDYGRQSTIQYSPADNTQAETLLTIVNADGVMLRPDAFSYSNDIGAWLANPEHALYYSVVENYRFVPEGASYYDENTNGNTVTTTTTVAGPGLDVGYYTQKVGRAVPNPTPPPAYKQTYISNPLGSEFTFNDDISIISNTGYEALVKHAERQDGAYQTLGVTDAMWYAMIGNPHHEAGRMESGLEYAMGDFQVRDVAPDAGEMIYFSAGRYGQGRPFEIGPIIWRPNAAWASGGSDYQGKANAGDILTQYVDAEGAVQRGIFEKAWKIAGCMVGDKFWDSGLVWNTWKGYVSTSMASTAEEAAGHTTVRDFLRYVFDITAMKVQDVNGDGLFTPGEDLVLFTVMSDRLTGVARSGSTDGDWMNLYDGADGLKRVPFVGQFFGGGAIFLYDGNSVTTYMDRGANLFFGTSISTGNATIWGEKYGPYDITGFDLTYNVVPEPGTIFMIVSALVGMAAAMRVRKGLRK